MDKLKEIQAWLKPKEFQLIDFIRNTFKAGKVTLVVHNHEPQRVIIKEPEIWFDGNLNNKSIQFNETNS